MAFILLLGREVFIKLFFGLRKSGNKQEREKKIKIKDQVKGVRLRSQVEGEFFDNEELTQKADNVRYYEDVITVVKEYENIIMFQK